MFVFVRKENHCLQDVCHDMTEHTLLNLIFTENLLTKIISFEGCNVCNKQYTFKRLNKIHMNGLMVIFQAFMWVTYVMQSYCI